MSLPLPELARILDAFTACRFRRQPTEVPPEFPRVMRDFHREFGAWIGPGLTIGDEQDHLYPTKDLRIVDGHSDFFAENQGNWTCRIALGEDDPEVMSSDEFHEENDGNGEDVPVVNGRRVIPFRPLDCRLSEILVAYALMGAVHSAPFLVCCQDSTGIAEALSLSLLLEQAPTGWHLSRADISLSADARILMFETPAYTFIGCHGGSFRDRLPVRDGYSVVKDG